MLHSWPFADTGEAVLFRSTRQVHNTTKHNLKYALIGAKHRGTGSTQTTPRWPVVGQKFPRYFDGHSELFAVFQIFYLFIPRFIAKPLGIFCGTLFVKHCIKVWGFFAISGKRHKHTHKYKKHTINFSLNSGFNELVTGTIH
jgi:hypothetical protein